MSDDGGFEGNYSAASFESLRYLLAESKKARRQKPLHYSLDVWFSSYRWFDMCALFSSQICALAFSVNAILGHKRRKIGK